MNIHDAFPSNYIKASDLGTAQPVVTIERVEYEEVGKTKDQKPVLYFAGKSKGLVLNKTNARKIIELLGSAVTEEWTGQRIRLFATTTEFAGETVECIRVKAAGNGQPAMSRMTPKQPEPPKPAVSAFEDEDDSSVPF
jgi:hypothetical protein